MSGIARTVIVVLLSCAAGETFAAKTIPRAEIDALVRPAIEGDWCRGVVVGIITTDETEILGYGTAIDSDARPPDGETVFEIGSVSKVFTGTLLADAIERKEVDLDDPVGKFLPQSVKVPARNGKQITLRCLATQSSGLPRLPDNLRPQDPADPYADYSIEKMYQFLSSYTLSRDPGAEYEYSNLGVGLLGHALALEAGKTYPQLLAARITDPLGMSSTMIVLDEKTRARLAQGHDADGDPVANWNIPTLAGAGGVRSTVHEMMKFLSANLGMTETSLGPAFRRAIQPIGKVDWANDIAMCWHVDKALNTPWHNGQTGGYHSFITFDPRRRFGLVVLSNGAAPIPDRIAIALTRRLNGGKLGSLSLPKAIAPDPKMEQAVCGTYMLSPLFYLTIAVVDGRLTCQGTGQPRIRLYAKSDTEYFCKAADAKITFRADPDGQFRGLVLHQNGKDAKATKIPAAKPDATRP